MPKPIVKHSLKETARRYGVSQAEMKRGMQEAIDAAFHNPDPIVQKRLKTLFPDRIIPTPENFVETVAAFLKYEQQKE